MESFSVRPQVEHSKVRSSNPRSPGEIRAKAIRCLQTGHIGRSLLEAAIPKSPGPIMIRLEAGVFTFVMPVRSLSAHSATCRRTVTSTAAYRGL